MWAWINHFLSEINNVSTPIVAIATVVMAFAATVSLFVSWAQWQVLSKQLIIDQRAWLGSVCLAGPLSIREGESTMFEVNVTNSGKSPALEVSTKIMAKSLPIGSGFVPDYPPLPGSLPHYGGVGVILSGMNVTLTTQPTERLTRVMMDALRSSQIVLYIYGEITYKDTFKQPHHTTFCMFVHPTLDRISFCKTYNDAD